MNKSTSKEQNFIKKAQELYKEYNKHKLMYKDFPKYDQLVTADTFGISQKYYKVIDKNGNHLLEWLKEQKELLREVFESKAFDWLKEIIAHDASSQTIHYEKEILNQKDKFTSIIRSDISSLPYNCHEAQLRWGGLSHIYYINKLYEKVFPHFKNRFQKKDITHYIQRVIDKYCKEENECCIYLSPDKYIQGNRFIVNKKLKKTQVTLVEEFNKTNFDVKKTKLVHRKTGLTVKLIFRRQISLETLGKTDFGQQIIKLYLDGSIRFEPDLDIINDMKIGMALAFDKRTRKFFSDKSRSLFLKTAIRDKNLKSFNDVFSTKYQNTNDFIQTTTRSMRKYIYKYAGMNMKMSFGGGEVYRLDDSKNHTNKILQKNSKIWIIQKMDTSRFKFRYLKGDYENLSTCEVAEDDKFSARLEIFYYVNNTKVKPITMIANLVNDHWKARFKTSNQILGEGSLITPVHIEKAPRN